jgi:hypothetical protein
MLSSRELDGRAYRAVVRLSTKADVTLALPGESCERVPVTSIPWLLAQGLIVPTTQEGAPVDGEA